jgi:Family of unknown function (DUF5335)
MAKQAVERKTQPSQAGTQKIAEDQWISFLAEFTRENRGGHARLEVLGTDSEHYVIEDRPFEGISSDIKDGEHAVWIDLGAAREEHLTHGVQNVTAILARSPVPSSGPALEIISKDGTRTLLELSPVEQYALPPTDLER